MVKVQTPTVTSWMNGVTVNIGEKKLEGLRTGIFKHNFPETSFRTLGTFKEPGSENRRPSCYEGRMSFYHFFFLK